MAQSMNITANNTATARSSLARIENKMDALIERLPTRAETRTTTRKP